MPIYIEIDVHVLCIHMEIKYMASRTLHFLVISLVCPAKLQNQSWLAPFWSMIQFHTVSWAFFLTSCHAIGNLACTIMLLTTFTTQTYKQCKNTYFLKHSNSIIVINIFILTTFITCHLKGNQDQNSRHGLLLTWVHSSFNCFYKKFDNLIIILYLTWL